MDMDIAGRDLQIAAPPGVNLQIDVEKITAINQGKCNHFKIPYGKGFKNHYF